MTAYMTALSAPNASDSTRLSEDTSANSHALDHGYGRDTQLRRRDPARGTSRFAEALRASLEVRELWGHPSAAREGAHHGQVEASSLA